MKTIESDTLSRRQLFPLLGGAVALATVAPNSTAADPSGPFGKPPAAPGWIVTEMASAGHARRSSNSAFGI